MTKAEVKALNDFYDNEHPTVQALLAAWFADRNSYGFNKKAVAKLYSVEGTPRVIFYPSIKEAARSMEEHGKGSYEDVANNIKKCISGKRGTACGFVWKLITEY